MDSAQRARCGGIPTWVISTGALLGVLALGGCGDRPYQDGLDLPPERTSRFIASAPLTPQSAVLVLAQVPPLRYAGGVIEITGGSEIMVVQPQAWRDYTGTALGVEEARRELARARRLDASLQELGSSADDLLELLHQRLDQPPPTPPAGPSEPARPVQRAQQATIGTPAGQPPLAGTSALRATQLQRISDDALTRLQQLLETVARTQTEERQRAEDRDAVACADGVQQQDQISSAHRATAQAATARDRSYQLQLQAAMSRDESQRSGSQQHLASTRQREAHESASASDDATRRAIAEVHARTARELQHWLEDDAPSASQMALMRATPAVMPTCDTSHASTAPAR